MNMDRREMLGVLGVTAAGVAVASGSVAYGQEKKEGTRKGLQGHEAMAEKSGKTCSDCANDCNKGFHHCHEKLAQGKQEYAAAAHLCVDCAVVCAASAALCGRVSPLMGHQCSACAESCDACIAECEKLKDSEMKEVIDACRETAKSCRDMARMMGSKTGPKAN
jgi:hypothetical protein